MSKVTVTLTHGWKIGEDLHHAIELRQSTALDILEAGAAGERLVQTETGYTLVPSPTRVGMEILKRQIASIGDLGETVVTDSLLKGLHPEDLERLQEEAGAIDNAQEATEMRGRDPAAQA